MIKGYLFEEDCKTPVDILRLPIWFYSIINILFFSNRKIHQSLSNLIVTSDLVTALSFITVVTCTSVIAKYFKKIIKQLHNEICFGYYFDDEFFLQKKVL